MAPRSAFDTGRVFGVAELLEQILSHLDPVSITAVQRVSRAFAAQVQFSLILNTITMRTACPEPSAIPQEGALLGRGSTLLGYRNPLFGSGNVRSRRHGGKLPYASFTPQLPLPQDELPRLIIRNNACTVRWSLKVVDGVTTTPLLARGESWEKSYLVYPLMPVKLDVLFDLEATSLAFPEARFCTLTASVRLPARPVAKLRDWVNILWRARPEHTDEWQMSHWAQGDAVQRLRSIGVVPWEVDKIQSGLEYEYEACCALDTIPSYTVPGTWPDHMDMELESE